MPSGRNRRCERLSWFKSFDKKKVSDWSFGDDLHVKWFEGGKLNVSYNCLDRHLETKKTKAAIIFEGNDPNDWKVYTYYDLYREVNKFANVLKDLGIKKGDVVTIYLPMIPELVITMLACTRIGALHAIVFGGFSAEALRDRINDCKSTLLITCDGTYRGAKAVPQKDNADKAAEQCPTVKTQIVVKRTGTKVDMKEGRDIWYEDLMAKAAPYTASRRKWMPKIRCSSSIPPVPPETQGRAAHDRGISPVCLHDPGAGLRRAR